MLQQPTDTAELNSKNKLPKFPTNLDGNNLDSWVGIWEFPNYESMKFVDDKTNTFAEKKIGQNDKTNILLRSARNHYPSYKTKACFW